MSEDKFQVGDIVYARGFGRGKVEGLGGLCETFISVRFDANPIEEYDFYASGKFLEWHTDPILELVERPKKIKKVWVNLYNALEVPTQYCPSIVGVRFTSKDGADNGNLNTGNIRIACVEIEVKE